MFKFIAIIAISSMSLTACATTSGPKRGPDGKIVYEPGVFYGHDGDKLIRHKYRTPTKPDPNANKSIYTLGAKRG